MGTVNSGPLNSAPLNAAGTNPVNFELSQNWISTVQTFEFNLDNKWNTIVSVNKQYVAPYRLFVDNDLNIDLRFPIKQLWTHFVPFSVQSSLISTYNLRAPVASAYTGSYTLLPYTPLSTSHSGLLPLRVDTSHTGKAGILTKIEIDFKIPYRFLSALSRQYVIDYNIFDFVPVKKSYTGVWSMPDPITIIPNRQFSVTHDVTGETITVAGISVRISEGEYAWNTQVTLGDPSDVVKFEFDDPFTVTLGTESYSFIVDSVEFSRGPFPSATVSGVSPSSKHDNPRAQGYTFKYDTPIRAKDAVEDILQETVDWRIPDWTIPANRLGGENVVPITAAAQVVNAIGGYLETDPDGTLYARRAYPIRPKERGVFPADHEFLETDDIISTSEQSNFDEVFDIVRIRDTQDSGKADKIEYESEGKQSRSGFLRIFAAPFRDLIMSHTSSASVILTFIAEEIIDKEEVVEVKEFSTSVAYPIYLVDSIEWLRDDLGGVSFDQYSTSLTTTDPDKGYSLLRINYKTRAWKYYTKSPIEDIVQYLSEESS